MERSVGLTESRSGEHRSVVSLSNVNLDANSTSTSHGEDWPFIAGFISAVERKRGEVIDTVHFDS